MSTYHFQSFQTYRRSAYLIFFLSASFYLYEYILQVAPSVMSESMMRTFHVTAKGFGIVSAFYFYAYAPMQLPAGLLFDRYGPRKLMTFALCLCALGSFFFASTDHLFTAALGRFFIGIGSAFSFIGVLVLLSRWFPPTYFAMLAGITQLMGSVGAIFGEMPLAALVGLVGWRSSSFILSALGVLLAILMWVLIRDYPIQPKKLPSKRAFTEEWQRFMAVCKRKSTWVIGAYAFSIWTPIAVFASLWAVPYLQQRFSIQVIAASGMVSVIWVGIGIGSPLLGWLSDYCSSRRLALILSAICGLLAALYILYMPNPSLWLTYVALLMYGIGAGGQTVSFAVINDVIEPEFVGTAAGFNNLSVLLGGAIFQPLVGIFLDLGGTQYTAQGGVWYTLSNYQQSFCILPIFFGIALLVSGLLLEETHPMRRSFAQKRAQDDGALS